jgi:cell division protein FtsN
MMEKFADDERIEQMSAAKKRERQMAHRRETERLLEQRREMFEKERQIEIQAQEEQKQVERYRRTVIEQERQRLLLEHAAQLREFLPRGVLKTREDVELVFGKDYVEQYGVGNL